MIRRISALALAVALFPVTGLTATATADTPRLVFLGDSYAANYGAAPYSDVVCARSADNYPAQVTRRAGVTDHRDVTCTGAEVADVWRSQTTFLGVRVAPQREALTEDTDTVVVNLGGNTMNMAGILGRCVELGLSHLGHGTPCTDHYGPGGAGHTWYRERAATLTGDLRRMIEVIHTDAPNAAVHLVGLPHVVNRDGTGCEFGDIERISTLARGDFPFFDDSIRLVNSAIREAATAADAGFIDLYPGTEGHDVCAPGTARWIGGLLEPTARPELISPVWLLHPNLAGVRNQAEQVSAALGLSAMSREPHRV